MESRVSVLEALIPTLATKSDLSDAKGSLGQSISDVKTAIADVRGDIKGWMLATVLTIVATIAAFMFSMFTLFKPQPQSVSQATQQPPVIINNIPPQQMAPIPTPRKP